MPILFREQPVTGAVALLYSVVTAPELKLSIAQGCNSPANDPATEHAVDTKTEVGASIPVYE